MAPFDGESPSVRALKGKNKFHNSRRPVRSGNRHFTVFQTLQVSETVTSSFKKRKAKGMKFIDVTQDYERVAHKGIVSIRWYIRQIPRDEIQASSKLPSGQNRQGRKCPQQT